ncbi:MAG: AAA family ATPase [Bdellovibrionota bacterium]
MGKQVFNCDRTCSYPLEHPARLVVLTGGPGVGKTAILEFLKKVLCEHVAILPEAASILFSGGFWRIASVVGERSAQKAIFSVQTELQNIFFEEKKWSLGLCDRGTLDGLAYWPGSEAEFFESLNTTMAKEYSKYQAVIHLRAPAAKDYNHQNPERIEPAEKAALIDRRIHDVWKGHSSYIEIQSTEYFSEKIYEAIKAINPFLPACCREKVSRGLR